jgi:hypothetical protein
MKPDDWRDFYFGDGVSGFDVIEEAKSSAVETDVLGRLAGAVNPDA